jgi:cation diffusion facilitator family transporter
MRTISHYEFSREQELVLQKARRLEYLSIAYLASVIFLMYLVMGASQAMKTAWVEDMLSLVPPICFLIGSHICWRKPTDRYPYGFHRVVSILFLLAAVALLLTGAFLLSEALLTLIRREHPTIGMKEFFGQDLWLGWWMLAVLAWGAVPPVLLGRAKMKLAKTLNDKILVTDGRMNKADWMTATAAMIGVIGIGFGIWWADAAAAAFISFDILKDGWTQTKDAVTGLMNRAPTSVDGKRLKLPEECEALLASLSWVKSAEVRMCEHGHLIIGDGFVCTTDDAPVSPNELRAAMQRAQNLDWRLRGFTLSVEPYEWSDNAEREETHAQAGHQHRKET